MKDITGNITKTISNLVNWCLDNWWIIIGIITIVVLFAFRQVIIAILTGQ